MTKILAIAAALVATAAAVPVVGRQRFRALVDADVRRLAAAATTRVGRAQLEARLDGLPHPVRRYLRYAIGEGTPEIRMAHLEHDGFFRTAPGQSWLPIEGEQLFTAATPGFVWNATVKPAPFLWIEARDLLLAEHGHMLVKFFSTFPIAAARGPEIDQGASLRWLAESAWFPYAFVGDRLGWDPIDARSARVTLRHPERPVSAVVNFDDEGKLATLSADRYRDLGGGKAVLTPWIGRYSEYRAFNGIRVPTSVEVAWMLEDGPFSYARFHVISVAYNVVR